MEISTNIFLFYCIFFFPGPSDTRKVGISSDQKDITTPLTTVPTPSSPVLNPHSMSPVTMSPVTVPTTMMTPGASWCVASQSASETALQVALDYACGHGGADCRAIQPGGSCYNPDTVRAHASYAFNSYFQKNPIPSSCNFGGTAVTTGTDPSRGTCQYESTSTTSSILDTTIANGSNVLVLCLQLSPPPK
ncbi:PLASMODESMATA CALLOSE-BINDING PROTEIN 1 [Hibiscus syriacus]|uniref:PLASMODESMATA CALLOSE-BINDING PROTEIN 1 n=1 Tax=Hibiscus syriacus TaxID=106335 RepID=A0A6A2ZSC0_HIBSY|nr:major pollen allergen Ole e 10-like [Hibiscus syriacus]KAE8694347.1 PLASMODESMATA CALLOSE-BINDING PROTEIN 1 [Hibiscus syriacus]